MLPGLDGAGPIGLLGGIGEPAWSTRVLLGLSVGLRDGLLGAAPTGLVPPGEDA